MPVETIPPFPHAALSNARFAQSLVQLHTVNPVGDVTALQNQARQPMPIPVRDLRPLAEQQARETAARNDVPAALLDSRRGAARQATSALQPSPSVRAFATRAYQGVLGNLLNIDSLVSVHA